MEGWDFVMWGEFCNFAIRKGTFPRHFESIVFSISGLKFVGCILERMVGVGDAIGVTFVALKDKNTPPHLLKVLFSALCWRDLSSTLKAGCFVMSGGKVA